MKGRERREARLDGSTWRSMIGAERSEGNGRSYHATGDSLWRSMIGAERSEGHWRASHTESSGLWRSMIGAERSEGLRTSRNANSARRVAIEDRSGEK